MSRSKEMRYINSTIKIERDLYLEIISEPNPWEYIVINF